MKEKKSDDIEFKDPSWICHLLRTALNMEKEKFKKCPIKGDIVPQHDLAEFWGYVTLGYSLLEQSLKAILHMRNREIEVNHELFKPFKRLPVKDQEILQKYYDDLFKNLPEMKLSSLKDAIPGQLDEFLKNLDGGGAKGSFVWRYFLTQDEKGNFLPPVHIKLIHEVISGCVIIIHSSLPGYSGRTADKYTYSWIRHYERKSKIMDWIAVRMNQPGWDLKEGRIEILWGPDLHGRHDYLVFDGSPSFRLSFNTLSKAKETGLKIIDKRDEFGSFDPVEGFRSIGVTVTRPEPHS